MQRAVGSPGSRQRPSNPGRAGIAAVSGARAARDRGAGGRRRAERAAGSPRQRIVLGVEVDGHAVQEEGRRGGDAVRGTAIGVGGERRRRLRQCRLHRVWIEAVAAGRRPPVSFRLGRPVGGIGENARHRARIGSNERELAHGLEHLRRSVQARKPADERHFFRRERGRCRSGGADAAIVRAARAGIEGSGGERRASERRGHRGRIRIRAADDHVELEHHRLAERRGQAARRGRRFPTRGAERHEIEREHGRSAGRGRGRGGGSVAGGRLRAMRSALAEALRSRGESVAHRRGVTGSAGGVGDFPPDRLPIGEPGVDAPRSVAALALDAG